MKNKLFSKARDFLSDNNGTFISRNSPRLGNWEDVPCGTCGLPPDLAAMAHEPWSRFDELADARGWDGRTRKIEMEIRELIARSNRIHWLREQIAESKRTGTAPLPEMTAAEQRWFVKEINNWRRKRERRAVNPAPTDQQIV